MNNIELKHIQLINKAKEYMSRITDFEHNANHMYDVVNYTYELLEQVNMNVNKEVCIISAYWHDVGRIKCKDGHEKLSAEMLKNEMEIEGYDSQFINECFMAIENHKWNMSPKNNEGLIVKDADKLGWIGAQRWKSCLDNGQNLDSIIQSLPQLKSDILYFNESKKIYDRDLVKLVEILYNYLRKEKI